MIPSTDEVAITCGKNCPRHKECLYTMVGICKVLGSETETDLFRVRAMPEGPLDSLFLQTDQPGQTEGMAVYGKLISSFGPDFWQRMGISEDYASKELPVLKKWLDVYRWLCFHEQLEASQVTLH